MRCSPMLSNSSTTLGVRHSQGKCTTAIVDRWQRSIVSTGFPLFFSYGHSIYDSVGT